jgi:hypothetical protein
MYTWIDTNLGNALDNLVMERFQQSCTQQVLIFKEDIMLGNDSVI